MKCPSYWRGQSPLPEKQVSKVSTLVGSEGETGNVIAYTLRATDEPRTLWTASESSRLESFLVLAAGIDSD